MKSLPLFLICIVATFNAQTFPIGHISINFKDPARSGGNSISGGVTMSGSGRTVGTEVYYPAAIAGEEQPLANGLFPVVVFGHGFVMTVNSYNNIYNYLASKGYIVMLPTTEGSFSPSHSNFGQDLSFVANQMQLLNTQTTPTNITIFNGKVLNKSAIGGHSMGAGSAYLAAANNSSLTCLYNFAAAVTNPSSISAASLITVPSLVISGARDCVVDTTVQNSHYTALNSAKKFHVIFKGLTHCDFGNGNNFNCTFGQTTSGCSNQVSNTLAFNMYMNYLEPFLANQLKNDCNDGQRFMDSINTVSSTKVGRKITGTIACITTEIPAYINSNILSVFPNPTNSKISIVYLANIKNPTIFELLDVSGNSVYKDIDNISISQSTIKELNIEQLSHGIYFLNVYQGGLKSTYKICKN